MTSIFNFTEEELAHNLANSYKNFHSKGLDYICLMRTPKHTTKVYFFDGDCRKLPEVINPHDHRYRFVTGVFSGRLIDHRFCFDDKGEVFKMFDYRTPLNGGDGFTYRDEVRLSEYIAHDLSPGHGLESDAEHIHTIQIGADQTVIMLHQYEDVVPIGEPTKTYVRTAYPDPTLDGLYDAFTMDEYLKQLKTIETLVKDFI